jgi:hypothetical protein
VSISKEDPLQALRLMGVYQSDSPDASCAIFKPQLWQYESHLDENDTGTWCHVAAHNICQAMTCHSLDMKRYHLHRNHRIINSLDFFNQK